MDEDQRLKKSIPLPFPIFKKEGKLDEITKIIHFNREKLIKIEENIDEKLNMIEDDLYEKLNRIETKILFLTKELIS